MRIQKVVYIRIGDSVKVKEGKHQYFSGRIGRVLDIHAVLTVKDGPQVRFIVQFTHIKGIDRSVELSMVLEEIAPYFPKD